MRRSSHGVFKAGGKFHHSLLIVQDGIFLIYVVALATSMSGMEICSSLLVLTLLINFCIEKMPLSERILPPFLVPMAALVVVAVIGILWGEATLAEKVYDLRRMRFFLLYCALFYYLFYYLKQSRWVSVLFWATLVVGIYGFFQHFIPLDLIRPVGHKVYLFAIQEKQIGPLVVGTFNHHLTFSNIYLFYCTLFLGLGFHAFPEKKRYLALGALLALLCFWTESRAAWVAVPVTLVILAWNRGRRFALLMAGFTAVVLLGLYFGDKGFRERFDRTLIKREQHYSLEPRQKLWMAQVEIWKDHPILGIGYNNNERHAKEYLDRLYPNEKDNFTGHAHSTPLQILATTGLLGLFAYLWMWALIFRACFVLKKRLPRKRWEVGLVWGLLAGFVGFQIQGLTQWNFGDAEVLHNVFFFIAVVGAMVVKLGDNKLMKSLA